MKRDNIFKNEVMEKDVQCAVVYCAVSFFLEKRHQKKQILQAVLCGCATPMC